MPKNMKRNIYEEEQDQYDERNRLFLSQKNADGKFYQTIEKKTTIVWVFVFFFVAFILGIAKHFFSIKDVDPQPAQPLPAVNQPIAQSQQQIQQEEKERAEREAIRTENEQELKQLQESFHPFEGMESQTDAKEAPIKNTENNIHHDINNTTTTSPININDNKPQQPTEPITPPIIESTTPPPASPEQYIKKADEDNKEEKNGSPKTYQLKGMANDNGIVYCYVIYNGITMRATEGDKVGEMTIQQIGQNFIVLVDEEGKRELLSM